MSLPWIYLIIAGLLEICWATGLKYTAGFTNVKASIFTISTLALSIYFLSKAAQSLPIGTAYAVWVGIGAIGTVLLGILIFSEPISTLRMVFVALLLISIIGLKYA